MQNILLNFLMWLLTTLSNIFVRPIVALVVTFIPSIATYIEQVQLFFTTYIFNPMRFCIRFLLNVTGLSQTVLIFGFTYLTAKVTLHVGIQVYKLIIRIWKLVKP